MPAPPPHQTRATDESDPWPPELAILAGQGLAPDLLRRAALLAERWGVAGDEALIASGLAAAEDVYRALAAALGIPYLAEPFAVHPLARYPEAVLGGIVPLAEGEAAAFAYAPRGRAFAGVAKAGAGRMAGLAICTPERLRTALFEARSVAIARSAAESLPRTRPDDSFYDGVTPLQLVWMTGGAIALAFGAFALAGGLRQAAALLMSLPFLGLTAIKLAAALERVAPPGFRPRGRTPDRDLPVYTVLVPLYRESRVLERLVGALVALDYPVAKIDGKILIEQGDQETAAALAAPRLPAFLEVVVVPPGQPRTKPRALNVGLAMARGRYLVVYDAEDVPDPGQLRDAVAIFGVAEPDVACLQARLVIDNTDDNHLTRFFTVEYGALFDVVNPALPRFDLPMPLGGTSNHLRVDVLRGLGGWDPWNVTEDADLSIRLAMAGHRIGDLPSSTQEEAPATLTAWMAQRARWMKGFAQVTITHSRRPIRNLGRLGPARLLGAAALIFGALASAIVYPVFTGLVVFAIVTGDVMGGEGIADTVVTGAGLVVLVSGLLAMTVPGFVAIRRRGWGRKLWPYGALMPVYYLLVSVAAWRSLWELARDPDRWNKTEHGLARTSRSRSRAGPGP